MVYGSRPLYWFCRSSIKWKLCQVKATKSHHKVGEMGGVGRQSGEPGASVRPPTGRLGASSSAGNNAGAGLIVPQEWRAQVTSQQVRPVVLNRADFVLLGTFGNVW